MKTRNLLSALNALTIMIGLIILNVTNANATVVTSIVNGNWTSGTSWSTGLVPAVDDSVLIQHDIVLDQTMSFSGYLKVDVNASLHKAANSQDLTLLSGGVIDDFGSIICRNFANYGTLNVYNNVLTQYYFEAANNFDNYSGGIVNNWGWIEIHTLTNLAGGEIYVNKPVGTISITNKLDNSGLIDNDWIVNITGNLVNNDGTLTGDGGTYYCDPTFTNNSGAIVDCNGAPINICRPNGTYPVVNGSGYVNTSCVLLCGGPWPTPQPVTIVSFTGTVKDGDVILQWVTGSEMNSFRHEVERSTGNEEFSMIGYKDGAMVSNEIRNYELKDPKAPAGAIRYRIKMVDTDGSFEYSNIIEVYNGDFSNNLVIYPNPANGMLNIVVESNAGMKTDINLRDINGNLVRTYQVSELDGSTNLQADVADLPNGTYIVEYFNGVVKKYNRVIVIH